MRTGFLLSMLVASAGCGTLLAASDDEAPPVDGAADAADGTAPGADGGDALADGSDGSEGSAGCAVDCGAGACLAGKCQAFTVLGRSVDTILGLAAADDRVFFTVPSKDLIRVQPLTKGAPPQDVPTDARMPNAIHVVGSKLQWVNQLAGTSSAGLHESAFDGSVVVVPPLGGISPGLTDIVATAPNIFHYSFAGSGLVMRREGGTDASFIGGTTAATFLAKIDASIVWMSASNVGVAPQSNPSAMVLIPVGAVVQGVATSGKWIYFTLATGKVGRVHPDAQGLELLTPTLPGATTLGAVSVSPNGKFVYWVQDGNSILGLAIP